MQKQNLSLPIAASFLVATIFSAHYLVAKIVLLSIPSQSLAAARGLVGGFLLGCLHYKKIGNHVHLRNLPALVIVASLGFCVNQLLLFAGLARTSPGDAALISSTIPIIATLLAMIFRIDRFRWRRLLGSLIGLLSVTVYLLHLHTVDLSQHVVGNILVFANILSFCTAFILVKVLMVSVPAEIVAAAMLSIGGVGLWVSGGDLSPVLNYTMSSKTAAALILFETIVTTALGYTLNLWVLGRLSVATTTVFNYLQLPLTVGLSWIFMDQRPNLELFLAFLGIIFACFIVSSGEHLKDP